MVTQMIEAHQDLRYFHIGADEVFPLCQCPRCLERLEESVNYTPADVFLSHVCQVLKFIKDKYPHLQLIMWDDMLRQIDASKMKEYHLNNLVEPMVWIYSSDINRFRGTVGKQGWDKLAQVFHHYWAASAFKGAFGGNLFSVPLGRHIQNHHLWLNAIHKDVPQTLKCEGVALTGWQRYQHFSPLCELLPVGLPSLACNLRILQEGNFNQHMYQDVSKQLGFPSLIPLHTKPPRKLLEINMEEVGPLSFPGSVIYQLVMLLSELVYVADDGIPRDADVRLKKMHELKEHMKSAMKDVYQEPTTNEWISARLMPMIQYIEMRRGSQSEHS